MKCYRNEKELNNIIMVNNGQRLSLGLKWPMQNAPAKNQ